MWWALVDQWMASLNPELALVSLDIDDTCDVVHGHQQPSLFNAHYDERCFLPIDVDDTERSRPAVVVLLRPGYTPSGVGVAAPMCAGSCAISVNVGTRTRSTFQATWRTTPVARRHGVALPGLPSASINAIGLPGSKPLAKKIDEAAEAIRTERAVLEQTSRARLCRNTPQGQILEPRAARRRPHRSHPARLDTRFVVTNVEYGAAEWVHATPLLCARGQAENLVELRETQARSDRTCFVPRRRPGPPAFLARAAAGSCSPFATPSQTARSRRRRVF